jgi:hypothetical protein
MTDMPAIGWSRGRRGREAVTIISAPPAAGRRHCCTRGPASQARTTGSPSCPYGRASAARSCSGWRCWARSGPRPAAPNADRTATPRPRATLPHREADMGTSNRAAADQPVFGRRPCRALPSGQSPTTSGASKTPWWPVAGMSRTSPPCRWTGAPSPSHPGREKSCCLAKAGTRCVLEAERGVEILAQQAVLKLSTLAQQVGQLLAVLHHNARVPHKGKVSPAMAALNGEDTEGVQVGGQGATGVYPHLEAGVAYGWVPDPSSSRAWVVWVRV